MVNDETVKPKLKACYGTSEYSNTSGICMGCKLKDNCGKIRKKHLNN